MELGRLMTMPAVLLLVSTLSASVATPATPAPVGAASQAASDTVLTVRRGERLVLSELEGSLVLVGVDGDRLRLIGGGTPGLRREGDRIVYAGRRRDRDLRIEAPRWMQVEIRGRDVAVEVRDMGADLDIRTIEGDIDLEDLTGSVAASTVDGEIRAYGLDGRVRLGTVDDDITVRRARGTLSVASTDGDLFLEDVDVESLDAANTDGDIAFSGAFRAGGRYSLVTHSGDIVVRVPRDADVDAEVSTFSGAFEAGFPVTIEGVKSGRRTAFTLGDGGARLMLETFSGDVEVLRPGG